MNEERLGSDPEVEEKKDTRDAAASLSTTVHIPRSPPEVLTSEPHLTSNGSSCLRRSL